MTDPVAQKEWAEGTRARIAAVLDEWLSDAAVDWWPDTDAIAARIMALGYSNEPTVKDDND